MSRRAAYNGTHPPPFTLPQEKTRSGIRTASTPSGEGYNELSFEDRQGAEQILVHAQRDLDEIVNRNHSLRVERDEILRIHGSRNDTIHGDSVTEVGGSRTQTVKGTQACHVDGDAVDVVSGNRDLRTAKNAAMHIEGALRTDVRGGSDAVVRDDATLRVEGCLTAIVGKHDAQTSSLLHVEGESRFSSSAETEIRSDRGLVFRCGESSILLTKTSISIQSPQLILRGGETSLQGSDEKHPTDAAKLFIDSSSTVGGVLSLAGWLWAVPGLELAGAITTAAGVVVAAEQAVADKRRIGSERVFTARFAQYRENLNVKAIAESAPEFQKALDDVEAAVKAGSFFHVPVTVAQKEMLSLGFAAEEVDLTAGSGSWGG